LTGKPGVADVHRPPDDEALGMFRLASLRRRIVNRTFLA
jgi:hypothetical protein